jgi:superfamily I DNA/RNA helicase
MRIEIQDLLAYLKLGMNSSDVTSFNRIISVLRIDISDPTLENVKNCCMKENDVTDNKDIFEKIRKFTDDGRGRRLDSSEKDALSKFLDLFSKIKRMINSNVMFNNNI